MKALFIAALLATLSCGGGYYYPGNGNGSVPKECRVSDGYCYRYVIVGDAGYWDVYVWTPANGWTYHHREPH